MILLVLLVRYNTVLVVRMVACLRNTPACVTVCFFGFAAIKKQRQYNTIISFLGDVCSPSDERGVLHIPRARARARRSSSVALRRREDPGESASGAIGGYGV